MLLLLVNAEHKKMVFDKLKKKKKETSPRLGTLVLQQAFLVIKTTLLLVKRFQVCLLKFP